MADGQGGEVTVPGVGPVEKKYVYWALGITAGIVGYAWWRHRGQSSAPALVADSTTGATGATGGSPPPIDTSGGGSTPGLITNNQQWTQDVLNKMGAVGGDEEGHILSVLGKYLNKVALQPDEIDIVRQAWALSGKPPEGPDNFIIASTGTGTGTPPPSGGGGGTTTTSVPGAVTGLHVTQNVQVGPSNDHIAVAWNPVSGATGYHVTFDDPWNLGQFAQDVPGTSASFSNIQALGQHVRVNVTAHNSAGNGPTAQYAFTAAGHFTKPMPPIRYHF
jgi:hypothetical protein